MALTLAWKKSRYTHFIELTNGDGIAYNGKSGAIIQLSKGAFSRCRRLLGDGTNDCLDNGIEADSLFPHLVAGEYVIGSDIDELAAIQKQYNRERKRSQFLLTILPTFGCNLGCDYCFVGKKRGSLTGDRRQQVIEFVEKRFAENSFPSMSVDWFGGEPLLALKTIEHLSQAFMSICRRNGNTPYSAQVISNGTLISERAVQVMLESGVNRLQITLDGEREIHNRRRPSKSDVLSSFEATIEGIERVIGKFLIRLRINIDIHNVNDVWGLLRFFEKRGWLGSKTDFYPYLARISPFSDACASVASEVCPLEEFQKLNLLWMKKLHSCGVPVKYQGLYQFPEPKLYNCGAIGENGFIINPNGEVHKCGLTVDDSKEAIGHLGNGAATNKTNIEKWADWNPFLNPICRDCKFLPSCLGGCPKNQLEMREVQKAENCEYFQQFENKMLAAHIELADG